MSKRTLVMLALCLSACGEQEAPPRPTGTFDLAALPGVYTGTLPCDNCSGIDVRLWLRHDGAFFMRQDYQATGDQPMERVHAFGRWTWDGAAMALVLQGPGPERRFSYEEPLLKMQAASGELHTLERDTDGAPFTDRVVFEGEYVSTGDVGVFAECVTGLKFRIQDDVRGRDLRRRHGSVSPKDRRALVTIEAHVLDSSSADAYSELLAMDQFVALKPGGGCEDLPMRQSPTLLARGEVP